MQIVYSIIGLSRAHEISGGKAALAVLVPTVICCGLMIFGFVMLFTMWIPNASFKDIAL